MHGIRRQQARDRLGNNRARQGGDRAKSRGEIDAVDLTARQRRATDRGYGVARKG